MTTDFVKRLASTDPDELYDALLALSRTERRELADLVLPLLEHADPEVRSAALKTLAFNWRLPELRATAERMARTDADPAVRASALSFWALYCADTADPQVLATLLAVALDPAQAAPVRESAVLGSLYVLGYPRAKVPAAVIRGDFDAIARWDLLADAYRSRGLSVPAEVAARS